jgi:hypothetical protein
MQPGEHPQPDRSVIPFSFDLIAIPKSAEARVPVLLVAVRLIE